MADGIRELRLADVNTSFDQLRRNADRRLQVWELEAKISDDPVLAAVGEAIWRTPRGCEALRETVGLSQAVATASPPAGIRARLNSAEGPAFARLLESSVVSIGLAAERYRRDIARLAALTGMGLNADGDDPAEVAAAIAPLLSALPSLGEWLDAARRRTRIGAIGLEPLIAAFEAAGISFQRLPDTFAALEVFYRAALAKRRHAPLQTMKSLDIENERRRFAATDQTLKQRQREAVRIKLLGNAIPTGTCAGRKKDWTELHCLRNELTKQARHIPIRTLLSRSRRAIQAMKPCFMMSPLSLAKYLPSQAMNFDLLVIDEASQMKPEDALGGLLRARQVIVVGDRNQLPPTDFFTRVTPAEEFGADADEDADDIDAEVDPRLGAQDLPGAAPAQMALSQPLREPDRVFQSRVLFLQSRLRRRSHHLSERAAGRLLDRSRAGRRQLQGRPQSRRGRPRRRGGDRVHDQEFQPPARPDPDARHRDDESRAARSDPRGVQPGGAGRGGRAIPRRLQCRHARPAIPSRSSSRTWRTCRATSAM